MFSRDPGARLSYVMISPTVYTCRHSLTITWSKDADIEYDTDIVGVTTTPYRKQVTFAATETATVSAEQSESYISVVALFSICAASTKK